MVLWWNRKRRNGLVGWLGGGGNWSVEQLWSVVWTFMFLVLFINTVWQFYNCNHHVCFCSSDPELEHERWWWDRDDHSVDLWQGSLWVDPLQRGQGHQGPPGWERWRQAGAGRRQSQGYAAKVRTLIRKGLGLRSIVWYTFLWIYWIISLNSMPQTAGMVLKQSPSLIPSRVYILDTAVVILGR